MSDVDEDDISHLENDGPLVDGEIRAVLEEVKNYLVGSFVAAASGDQELATSLGNLAQQFLWQNLTPWHITRAIFTSLWPTVTEEGTRLLTDSHMSMDWSTNEPPEG